MPIEISNIAQLGSLEFLARLVHPHPHQLFQIRHHNILICHGCNLESA